MRPGGPGQGGPVRFPERGTEFLNTPPADRDPLPSPVQVRIRRCPGNADLPLPAPATAGSVGWDLRASVAEEIRLEPGRRARIATGFAIAAPPGYEAQIRPRSGLADRQGLTLLNAPGTIDPDYRGEIQVILINHGDRTAVIRRGDRIAQMVFQRVPEVSLEPVEELPETARGSGGFGHTG